MSIAVMAPGGTVWVPATVALAVLLAAIERAWVRAIALPALAAATGAVAYVLPNIAPYPAVGIVGLVSAYLLRLIAIGGIATHLVRTTTPTDLTTALRAARIPRVLTVPSAVMLRFLPTVLSEARAVIDAMQLKGIGGVAGWIRHPIRSIEYLTVPLLASSIRVAEDLSASALLRGLGSPTAPTTMLPSRFGKADVVVVAVAAGLAVGTVLCWRSR